MNLVAKQCKQQKLKRGNIKKSHKLTHYIQLITNLIFLRAVVRNKIGSQHQIIFDQDSCNGMFPTQASSVSHESGYFIWVKWVNEPWVMSQWLNESIRVRSEKIKVSVWNNKIKHYFYLICLLASLLPAHARPISDMKSQPGLFVSSIPGPAATTTCMPRKIAFPDTPPLQRNPLGVGLGSIKT